MENFCRRELEQLAAYQRQLWERPKLTYLYFELTDRCNLRCLHCGSSCTGQNGHFLSYEQIKRVLLRVAEAYEPEEIMVCLTGGEPMLHPDLIRVVRLSNAIGFPVGMTTNGTLIGNREAEALADAGLDTVAVSVDGVGAVHDALRNSPGSFDRAIAGAQALRRQGLDPEIISVIHRRNVSGLEEMLRCFQGQGFEFWRLVSIDPIGRARQNEALLLEPRELRALFDFIEEKRRDPACPMVITYGCSHFATLSYERRLRNYYFQCGAGTKILSIAANGDIRACLDIERRAELAQGNIARDDVVEVWEHRFQPFRRDRTADSPVCGGCEQRDICLGDSAHTWDYDQKQPNYCVHNLLEGLQ